MFSRRVVFVCVFLLVALAHSDAKDADIFGLKKGMSISEIHALGFGDVKEVERDLFIVENPKMPRGADMGSFSVSSSSGLLKAVFIWRFEASLSEATKKHDELRNMLIKKYGKGKDQDSLKSDLNEYEFILKWEKPLDAKNKWELDFIQVKTKSESSDRTMVMVTYQFRGWVEYLRTPKNQ